MLIFAGWVFVSKICIWSLWNYAMISRHRGVLKIQREVLSYCFIMRQANIFCYLVFYFFSIAPSLVFANRRSTSAWLQRALTLLPIIARLERMSSEFEKWYHFENPPISTKIVWVKKSWTLRNLWNTAAFALCFSVNHLFWRIIDEGERTSMAQNRRKGSALAWWGTASMNAVAHRFSLTY